LTFHERGETWIAVSATTFLTLNVALAFYNVGTIWAHEVDIFRTWKLIDVSHFHQIQAVHWHKLPFWIFSPLALALAGGIALLFDQPAGSPPWGPWGGLGCQVASHLMTAFLWGPWQAKLSNDPLGPGSPYLKKILATHWIRTGLINAYAFFYLAWLVALQQTE
jgi:hypothetical protein